MQEIDSARKRSHGTVRVTAAKRIKPIQYPNPDMPWRFAIHVCVRKGLWISPHGSAALRCTCLTALPSVLRATSSWSGTSRSPASHRARIPFLESRTVKSSHRFAAHGPISPPELQDASTDHIRDIDVVLHIDRNPAGDDELASTDTGTAPLRDEPPGTVELPDTVRAIVR